jgi:hypothetical protein
MGYAALRTAAKRYYRTGVMASAILAENLRIVRRRPCLGQECNSSPRPSILDCNAGGDPWIGLGRPDCLTLFLGSQPIVSFAGTALDWMSLNSRLQELRQGKPRRKWWK